MQTTQAVFSGKAYACSAIGFVHIGAWLSSLLTFVCNESATWCTGKGYCVPPIYASTYKYFSAIALASFLSSIVIYIIHCTAAYEKLPCSFKRKVLGEILYMILIVIFLTFGNLFMISRTGNRTVYMISTVFGCIAMAIFGIQLALVLLRNRPHLNFGGSKADSIDDVDSKNSDYLAGEFGVQITHAKHLNIGGFSPANSPKLEFIAESSQVIPHNEDSDSFSSGSEEDN